MRVGPLQGQRRPPYGRAAAGDPARFAAPAGWRSLKAGGSVIVLFSAAVVASMVGSIVLGPLGDQVLARDGYSNRDIYASPFAAAAPDPTPAAVPEPPRPRPRERSRWERVTRWFGPRAAPAPRLASADTSTGAARRQSVCVRLCDGYFFPVGDVHAPADLAVQAASCSDACPGAPTRLYTLPSGRHDIGTAVAVTNGQPYTMLPMAYSNARETGPTCACHTPGASPGGLLSPLHDLTLRKGDSVMTPVGWRIFRGANHWPYRRDDFNTLAATRDLGGPTRSALVAMENASLRRSPGKRMAETTVRISLKADETVTAAR